MTDLELLRRLAAGASITENEAEAARTGRDYQEDAPLEARPGHPATTLTNDEVRGLVSDEARLALIGFEVTSEEVYRRKYERPIAPAGDSGVTIGIGYDLGYNAPDGVRRDLAGLIPARDIEALVLACGLRNDEARQRLSEFKGISVPWEAALQVFHRSTVPKFGRKVLNVFPNAAETRGHAFGALLSLVYNRGDALTGDRRSEMRVIHQAMAERAFQQVPEQLRSMIRLWQGKPGLEGLVKRREAEARLFERGLELRGQGASAGARFESLTVAAPQYDKQGRIEALYYEIGLFTETASRENVPVETLKLEIYHESLASTIQSLGNVRLKATGAAIVQKIERELYNYLCGGTQLHAAFRSGVDDATRQGTHWLRGALVNVLSTASMVPPSLIEKVVAAVVERMEPVVGGAGAAITQQLDGGVTWLCQRWTADMANRNAMGSSNAVDQPSPSSIFASSPVAPVALVVPISQAGALLTRIEQCAAGAPPDTAGAHHNIKQLLDLLRGGSAPLTSDENARFVNVLCNTRYLDQMPLGATPDPYAAISQIETAVAQHNGGEKPLTESTIDVSIKALHALLGDARIPVHPDHIGRALKALRSARRFDDLAVLADRFVARDPSVLGQVSHHYAQGLIDSGRIVAGIAILNAALDNCSLSSAQRSEVNGILGRGHKQIYVNHVRSESDAAALGEPFKLQLKNAAECYRRDYDPVKPGQNVYQGINYIALLKRAERDRVDIGASVSAEVLARGMIDALKPAAAKSNDPWAMATLGEAYLALGEFENAARWFGTYANDPNVDAFALSGTVRQLEEVWRLKAGPHGAGAIVAGLKAALIRVENGQLRLDGGERRALAQAGDAEFKDLFELESKTPGGIQIKLADLQRIVRCASAVAGIKKVGIRGADTVGTGFLINGSDFGPGFSDADSYLLTNAHVLWNPDWAPERNLGRENDALLPAEARIVFETDQNDGRREVYTCKQVIWQSPSSLHDATLIQLDRKVAKTPPLQIATKEAKLVPDYDGGKGGTKLVVIGHPEGGPLSLGISGSIEEMQATLLDKGTRANASDPVFLHYRTPTEPGNSGSPVFEVEKWQVVGLHHAGFPEGGRPKLGGKAGRHAANEGIWIESVRSAVMEHVKAVSRKGRRKWFG